MTKSWARQNVSMSVSNNAKMKSRHTRTKGGTPKMMSCSLHILPICIMDAAQQKGGTRNSSVFRVFLMSSLTKNMTYFTVDCCSLRLFMILATKNMTYYAFGTLAGATHHIVKSIIREC